MPAAVFPSSLRAMKSVLIRKEPTEIHLSPSRRRALRREIVQTSGGVQCMLQAAPSMGSRKGAAISHCERK